MKFSTLCCTSLIVLSAATSHTQIQYHESPRAWLTHVRIGAYSLTPDNAEQIVQQAQASGVYGIEVDNDIPGRYESLGDPDVKLKAIQRVAAAAHRAHNKAYVYVAGFECISAHSDSPHTLAKEHPEWLQRKLDGQPAVFDTKAAFWIAKGEEDAWVSPYAADWRKLYMQRIRQIAGTGIDGIYVDIPYWMTHFTGWEDSWASFDDATVAAFKKQTGLDAKTDIKLGDYEDAGFRKWITFRIQTITDFLAEMRATAIAVNPSISLIPEIYPGIEAEAPRVGADVYQLYPVVDAIAHEYEFGDAEDHTAASRSQLDWFQYQIGIRSFRAFGGEKPTWILNYSWDGAPNVKPRDAMLNLASSELTAGANVWDAQGHVMSGSNDMATRSEIFHWIAQHDDIFGRHREPVGSIGVYFSDTTRNFYPHDFVDSYRGLLLLLMRNHIQFRIVTPRTIKAFDGKVLVLPNVRVMSDEESESVKAFAMRQGKLVITGDADPKLQSIRDAKTFADAPERAYLRASQQSFVSTDAGKAADLLKELNGEQDFEIKASQDVVAHVATIGERHYVFLENFAGLKPGELAVPAMQHGITFRLRNQRDLHMHVLPFLGKESDLPGKLSNDAMEFVLPDLERGAVVWWQ